MRFNSNPDFAALLSGVTLYRKVELPFLPGHFIAVRVLDDLEIDACRLEGQRKFRKACEAQKWDPVQAGDLDPTLIERMVEREFIIKAFYDPDTIDDPNPTPFFASEAELTRLGSVRTTDLMDIYVEHQTIANPFRVVSEEQMEGIVEALGKEPKTESTLTGIEPRMLRRYVISLASRLYDSRTSRSSIT